LKWSLQRLNLLKWFCEGLCEAVGGKQKGQEAQKRQKSFLLFLSFLPFLLPFQFCLQVAKIPATNCPPAVFLIVMRQ